MNAFSPANRGLGEIVARVSEVLGERILDQKLAHEELTLSLAPEALVEAVTILRDDPQLRFINLIDICGVDWPEREKRFDVVYHFLSPYTNHRIRLKVMTDAETAVPSLCEVFPAATWFEREAYDFYGILFSGNPDFRRILTDYGFRGHPLRKDFPTTSLDRKSVV